ncbi:hypothetical protein [Rhizobium sp. LjRoot254]|uniref:hypothetical protein n=1 Tax=Rhizobium sp. LjRoot254 TaxID=3342297 RepID=UPI003ED00ED6
MPTSHDLKGLMKFLARDQWRDCFEEVFDDHFGPVLDPDEMEFDDLAELLGDDWAMTLWGCAFEDFLSQDFEVEGNMVDEYLKRRGWREGAQAKAYMKALRSSVMSLYEVSEVVPGKSLLARDLLRGGAPVLVSEGTATKTLKQWDRVAARIVPVLGKNTFAGGLLPFTLQASENLFDGLRAVFAKKNSKKLPVPTDEELRAAAPMFTLSWLFDTLDRAMNVDLAALQNADGDEIVFHEVRFPLASGVTQKDVAGRLDAIPALRAENAKFWNWLEDEQKGGGKAKQACGLSLDSVMDDGFRVLGNIELNGRFLHLSVNSAARAERGTAIIQQSLADLVRTPLTEIRTVEQMMADGPEQEAELATSVVPPEVAEQIAREFMDQHYRETLDQQVGMLGNKTPRQAVKTPNGRKKVVEWLKYLENQTAKRPNPSDPMASYSFQWMWEELGIQDLRG